MLKRVLSIPQRMHHMVAVSQELIKRLAFLRLIIGEPDTDISTKLAKSKVAGHGSGFFVINEVDRIPRG